jgi:hypothetical protein
MTDRWVALLAAGLGLLGVLGGAAVGGYEANSGQRQQLEQERTTHRHDLRMATYVKFLGIIEAQHEHGARTRVTAVRAADAEVALVAPNIAIREAAARLTEDAETYTTDENFLRLRRRFIELAHAGLESDE